MRMLSLFAGIGGIDLAASWADIKTVAFCEIDPFCQKVLQKHWPGVPIFDDVRTINKQQLFAKGVIGDGRTVDIICGGYPCQPFSVAGERKGKNDDRHLWPEVSRLLQEIRPDWFLGENVAGHVTLGLDDVLSDLEGIGYTAEPFIIPAAAVGASHRRDRVFVLAHSNSKHLEGRIWKEVQGEPSLQGFVYPGSIEKWAERSLLYQPKLLGAFNGIPNQVDRIRALGNAVVPQQIFPILWAMKRIHDQAA